MDLKQTIALVAAQWGLPYRERQDARDNLPCGADATVDLTIRIKGRLSRGKSSLVAPDFDPLTPTVLATLAKSLKIEPDQLKAALGKAISAQIANKTFQPDAGLDPADPHIAAIQHAIRLGRRKLKRTRRAGKTSFRGTGGITRKAVTIHNKGE